MSKKTWKIFFVAILKPTGENSRIRIQIGSRIRSVCQSYGFADPNPYQNVTDLRRCPALMFFYIYF